MGAHRTLTLALTLALGALAQGPRARWKIMHDAPTAAILKEAGGGARVLTLTLTLTLACSRRRAGSARVHAAAHARAAVA